MLADLQRLDTILFLAINQSISHRVLDNFFLMVTEPKNYIIPGVVVFLIFFWRNWRKTLLVAILAAITLALTDTLCAQVLKPLFSRARPCHPELILQGARCIGGLKSSFSFPSAHAMNIFAQATLFAFLYPAKSVFFFVFAIIIGLSRVYIGVHYPLDVIGGAVGGSIIAAIVYGAYSLLKRKYRRQPA